MFVTLRMNGLIKRRRLKIKQRRFVFFEGWLSQPRRSPGGHVMFRSIFKKKKKHKYIIPTFPRNDDLYLVEFPKCGVTWLSFLIANTNLLLRGEAQQRATFFNISGHVAELDVSREIPITAPAIPGFRVIKSHSRYNPNFKRVFYMVRDPRSVMVSYQAFLQQTGWFNTTLEELIEHPQNGVRGWTEHVLGWLERVPASHSFALIRYEDLMDNPLNEMRSLYHLLGFEVPDNILMEAIERSSAEKMRRDEELYNSRHPQRSKLEFVRKGKLGGPREPLSPKLQRRIEELAGGVMARLGYSEASGGIGNTEESKRL
jgi:hypothetical protein